MSATSDRFCLFPKKLLHPMKACCINGNSRCAPSAIAPSVGIAGAIPAGREAKYQAMPPIATKPAISTTIRGAAAMKALAVDARRNWSAA